MWIGTAVTAGLLMQVTGGSGPDACMDAVGLEAHTPGPLYYYDRVNQALMLESDRPMVLREAILACRNGGVISIPGVYGGFIDKLPMGAMMNKGLTIKTGQTHCQHYFKPLLQRIANGEIDPSFVVTHRIKFEDAPKGYDTFLHKGLHQDRHEAVDFSGAPFRQRSGSVVQLVSIVFPATKADDASGICYVRRSPQNLGHAAPALLDGAGSNIYLPRSPAATDRGDRAARRVLRDGGLERGRYPGEPAHGHAPRRTCG